MPKKTVKAEETEEVLDVAELEAESQKAQETIKKQKVSEEVPSPKMYSEDEVRQMLQQVMKDKNPDDLDADVPEVKRCTIPRFNNKFVIAFKDMNTDEYTTTPVYATDLRNATTNQIEPWVTLIFDDASELTVPLNTALDKSNKITCEIIKIQEVDASYDFGKVEKQEVRDSAYSKSGTGVMVKTKVTQMLYTYEVKLPEPDGRIVVVSRDVMNWKVATLK